MWTVATWLILLCVCCWCVSAANSTTTVNPKPVPLASIKALTFRNGVKTTFRRAAATWQLGCTGGCNLGKPGSVECVNIGSDGRVPQWRCDAALARRVRFKHVRVSCEGWVGPSDTKNVVAGSCALEYSLTRGNSVGLSGAVYAAISIAIIGTLLCFAAIAALLTDDSNRPSALYVPSSSSNADDAERAEVHYHTTTVHSGPGFLDFVPGFLDFVLFYSLLGSFWSSSSSSSSSWGSSYSSSSGFGGTRIR